MVTYLDRVIQPTSAGPFHACTPSGMTTPRRLAATVLVLGDLGRSPRMVNHAHALSAHGYHVDLVGYGGVPLPVAVRNDPAIHVHLIVDDAPLPGHARTGGRYVLRAAARALRLAARLARTLLVRVRRPDVLIVQNPPGVPTLPIAWAAARLRGARFFIDWHNLTSAMLALRVGDRHWLVRIVGWMERAFGRRADLNLFVSAAMRQALGRRWGLAGVVLRDRPAGTFARPDPSARATVRAEIFRRIGARSQPHPPLLVISPTSWTADEDVGLLLEGAVLLDTQLRAASGADDEECAIAILITGRGELRGEYERRIAALDLRRVTVATAWIAPDEYPHVIGAADIGLCLHRSASGLDLPMKVMDFYGAGVPVCMLDYAPCVREAVRHGDTGVLFSNAQELVAVLSRFALGSVAAEEVARLRAGAARAGAVSWQAGWEEEVLPLLRSGDEPLRTRG